MRTATTTATGSAVPIQDLRVPEFEIQQLLDRLDQADGASHDEARRSTRHVLRGAAVVVIIDRSPYIVAYRVRVRNVSCHGIGFLSGTPMLPGTRVRVRLPIGPDRAIVEKPAVIRRCRHVQGTVHDVGAEYGHPDNALPAPPRSHPA